MILKAMARGRRRAGAIQHRDCHPSSVLVGSDFGELLHRVLWACDLHKFWRKSAQGFGHTTLSNIFVWTTFSFPLSTAARREFCTQHLLRKLPALKELWTSDINSSKPTQCARSHKSEHSLQAVDQQSVTVHSAFSKTMLQKNLIKPQCTFPFWTQMLEDLVPPWIARSCCPPFSKQGMQGL